MTEDAIDSLGQIGPDHSLSSFSLLRIPSRILLDC